MRIVGYLEHLDLGLDPTSGEKNILVQSVQEYHELNPEQRERAWATIKVSSEIQEVTPAGLYGNVYNGKTPSKIIKKNAYDRHGLTLVKIPPMAHSKAARREADIQRAVRVAKRAVRVPKWMPPAQAILIGAIVDMKLRAIERELFVKGTTGDRNTEGEQYGYCQEKSQ